MNTQLTATEITDLRETIKRRYEILTSFLWDATRPEDTLRDGSVRSCLRDAKWCYDRYVRELNAVVPTPEIPHEDLLRGANRALEVGASYAWGFNVPQGW